MQEVKSDGICFEPTYEELKPLPCISFHTPQSSFEPTYEELKQEMGKNEYNNIEGFEPTYEELKLGQFNHKI